jgi:glutamyl-tRNA synthetase
VPDEGEITFTDAVLGEITNPYSAINDFVIQRSDGSPLYNLAVAVDDRDMGITHIVRGQDHVSNTPRQLMLVRALGAEPPVYAHIPLLHGPDGKKLSKRHGAASVQEVREQGYLPEAIRNYIALLGWGYDESTTFMTTDELVERFALDRVSKNPAVFDEQKLRWMNGRYMRELPLDDLHARLCAFYDRDIPIEIVEISREKMQTLADFWPLAGSLIEPPAEPDETAWGRWGPSADWQRLFVVLSSVEPFDVEHLESALGGLVQELDVKPKEIYQPLRVALTGKTVSPGIFESLWAVGREESLSRVEKALRRAESAAT